MRAQECGCSDLRGKEVEGRAARSAQSRQQISRSTQRGRHSEPPSLPCAAGESECRPGRQLRKARAHSLIRQDRVLAKAQLSPRNAHTYRHRAGCTPTLKCTDSLCAHVWRHCRGDTHNGMHTSTLCSSQRAVSTHTDTCSHTRDSCCALSPCAYTLQWCTHKHSRSCTHISGAQMSRA